MAATVRLTPSRRLTYSLPDRLVSRVDAPGGAAGHFTRQALSFRIAPLHQGGRMAKVSWNRTWSIKMRKKSRRKKGKNRTMKKK